MPSRIFDVALTPAERMRRSRANLRKRVAAMAQVDCACGCGEKIPPVRHDGKTPRRFAAGHNGVPDRVRARPSNWRGGTRSEKGYVLVYVNAKHVMARGRNRYVPEHRVVMAEHLGRALRGDETVHHKNGVRHDNRIENLELRQGQHGPGAVYRCCDCGSHNVEPQTTGGQT